MLARQRSHHSSAAFSLLLLIASTAGCVTGGGDAPRTLATPYRGPQLTVENGHWQEVRVYVIRGQSARRLVGSVMAGESAVFDLRTAQIGEPIRVLVRPVSNRSKAFLLPNAVTTGETVVLRIANILNRSVVWVPG